MRTAHKNHVEKLVCPVCDQFVSTTGNMRVHLKRKSKRTKKKYVLHKGKINGKPIKRVWVPAGALKHGRFYGEHTFDNDDSSEYSDSDNVPLSLLQNLNGQDEALPIQPIEEEEPMQIEQSDCIQGIFLLNREYINSSHYCCLNLRSELKETRDVRLTEKNRTKANECKCERVKKGEEEQRESHRNSNVYMCVQMHMSLPSKFTLQVPNVLHKSGLVCVYVCALFLFLHQNEKN